MPQELAESACFLTLADIPAETRGSVQAASIRDSKGQVPLSPYHGV